VGFAPLGAHPLGNNNHFHRIAPNSKVSGLPWHEQRCVRRGMCDGRHATLWLLPLCWAFPATGEIDGHVSPEPLVRGQRPHFSEMLGLKLLTLGGGQL
jgi:hypothetical protein